MSEVRQADSLQRLRAILRSIGQVAIAVSGGVDSLTLAAVAHDTLGVHAAMHHAVSPAVPAEATERTCRVAAARGWALDVFDAGEFADPMYRANPVNRCFFCKTNLYGAIARRTAAQIASGTNSDDLNEYRPGLDAARVHRVRHPFVEAGIDKAEIRRLAARLELGSVADLPSSPCLSSRIETGLPIAPDMLAMVERTENFLRGALSSNTLRCRVRARGIVIELDPETLQRLDSDFQSRLRSRLVEELGMPDVSFAPYRNGSAFVGNAP